MLPRLHEFKNGPIDLNFLRAISALSLRVYKGSNKPKIPEGYNFFCDSTSEIESTTHYYGEAHYLVWKNAVSVIISHRGTTLNYDNLYDDFLIYINHVPVSWEIGSKLFTDYVSKAIKSIYPEHDIYYAHIGHSLGAIHADLCFAYQAISDWDNVNRYSSVTFENPGSRQLVKSMVEDSKFKRLTENVDVHNADVNAINTCNEQLNPKKVNCYPVGYDFNNSGHPPYDKLYYLIQFTPDQHKMEKLYKLFQRIQFNENINLPPSPDVWPVGLSEGFKFYMQFYNHSDYWLFSLKNYWDNTPSIHAEFDDHFVKFVYYARDNYLSGQVQVELKNSFDGFKLFSSHSQDRSNSLHIDDFVIIENNSSNEKSADSKCLIS